MKLEARLASQKFRHDQEANTHLVISLTAPVPSGQSKRPSLCLVPVIDLSGSMDGGKLEYAKRSAIKLVEHLAPGDYCGIVGFESNIHVIVAPMKIESAADKDKLKAEIGKLRTMGGTNLAGGYLKAAELINRLDLPSEYLVRIIMLTDGDANEGIAQKPADLLKLLGANLGRASVSAFGYGRDVKHDFLGDFAKLGKGNYAFIDKPDSALTAFGAELGGLLSTYATDITIDLAPLNGHVIGQVISDVTANEEEVTGEVGIKIPDLLAEETRNIVLAVKLAEQKQALPRAVNVFDVKVGYDYMDETGKKAHGTIEVKAKAQFVKAGDEDKPDADLDKIVGLAQVVRAQIDAEALAAKGNFSAARDVMQKTAGSIRRRGLVGVADMGDRVGATYLSQESYQSGQTYRTSVSRGATRGMSVALYDASAAADLGDAGVVMKNSLMADISESFMEEPVPTTHAGPPTSWATGTPPAVPGDLAAAFDAALADPAFVVPSTPEAPKPTRRTPIKQTKSSTRW